MSGVGGRRENSQDLGGQRSVDSAERAAWECCCEVHGRQRAYSSQKQTERKMETFLIKEGWKHCISLVFLLLGSPSCPLLIFLGPKG